MKQLCDELELDKVMTKYVKESDEEESRTVEMYDMVSLVSTRSSKLAVQCLYVIDLFFALSLVCRGARNTDCRSRRM